MTVLKVIGALAFALAGLRTPGRRGFLAFVPAALMLVLRGGSNAVAAAALGCGLLALFRAPSRLPQAVGAGVLALSPALMPWLEPERGGASACLLAFAFSLFLTEGARGMKGREEPEDARWFALACAFLAAGFAAWMWEEFLHGGDFLQPGLWAVPALLSCALVAGGWQRKSLGAEFLALSALMGLWLLAV